MGVLQVLLVLTVVFSNVAYSANGASPQRNQCIPLSEKMSLIDRLKNEMGEFLLFGGRSSKEAHSIQVFTNPDTGSWTVLGTNPIKVCILDFGKQGKLG
tara:strand:+ start:47 stop:343 length:297 start_codon:yes stop_codon:yes gene_type:complete